MTDPALELALLRREVALEKRVAQLEKENAIAFYQPHEKQYQFHIADFRFRHCRWGNQSGKSDAGGVEDVSHALGYRPFMESRFPIINGKREVVAWHEGYKNHPYATLGISPRPTKGLIIVQDWEKSKEVFTELSGENRGKLFHYIPKSALGEPTRNHSGAIDRIPIRHISGGWSMIHIDTVKSYKQDPMALESSIWDWIHVDEPCPEGMFKAAARGLMARNGRAWLNLTPLTEPWIQDMFAPDMNQLDDVLGSLTHKDRYMIFASMYDNPHLTDEGRAAFIELLTEEEKECRVSGIPTAYSGLVYKEFRWQDHVHREPPPGWTDVDGNPSWLHVPADHSIRFAIDYHPRKPHHVLFIATDPYERQYVFAEIFRSCLMSELVSDIREVLRGREPASPGLIDPLADTPNRVTDLTALEEVARLGLPVIPATKDPHNGILRVKELLRSRDRAGNPTLVVASSVTRFLFEISRGFIWDKDTNKPLKKDDDAMENFYRLCLQGLQYIEPSSADDYIPTRRRDPGFTTVDPFEFLEPAAVGRTRDLSRYRN